MTALPWPLLLTAAMALAAVLLLMAGLAAVVRRWPALKPGAPASSALSLQAALRLDQRRCLFLVEADGQRFLILAGGETDTMAPLAPPGA